LYATEMSRLSKLDLYHPILKTGLGGNLYVISTSHLQLCEICASINKSHKSIYWSKKYCCFAIRIKSKTHKARVRELLEKKNDHT